MKTKCIVGYLMGMVSQSTVLRAAPVRCASPKAALLAIAVFLAALGSSASAAESPSPAEPLHYDEVQQRSIHNAYLTKVREGLMDQLIYYRVRNFEWDIHSTSPWNLHSPGYNDWFMYHTAVAGEYGRFDRFSDYLEVLRAYHDAVPEHEVITINLEFKGWNDGNFASVFPGCEGWPDAWDRPLDPGGTAPPIDPHCGAPAPGDPTKQSPAGLDARLREELGDDVLFEPRDLLDRCPSAATLLEAVGTCGWPTVDELRGRIIVVAHAWTWTFADIYEDLGQPNPGTFSLLQTYGGGSHEVAVTRAAFVAPLKLTEGDWPAKLEAHPWVVFHTEEYSIERAAAVRQEFPGVLFRSSDRDEASFAEAQATHNFLLTDHISWHHTPWARTHNAHLYPFCPRGVTGSACWEDAANPLADKRERQHLLAVDVRSGDIWDEHDDFAFAWSHEPITQPTTWSGFVSGSSNSPHWVWESGVHHWAKGCLMLRADLSPESPYYAVCRAGDEEELFIQWRGHGCDGACGTAHDHAALGDGTLDHRKDGEEAIFVKLEAVPAAGGGVSVQGYGSMNGRDYAAIGDPVSFPIDLPYQGLAASSHDWDASNADGTPTRWLFGNVQKNDEGYTFDPFPGKQTFTQVSAVGSAEFGHVDLSAFGDRVQGSICGNGMQEFGEFCDDGNTAVGDGCSSVCEVEQDADEDGLLDEAFDYCVNVGGTQNFVSDELSGVSIVRNRSRTIEMLNLIGTIQMPSGWRFEDFDPTRPDRNSDSGGRGVDIAVTNGVPSRILAQVVIDDGSTRTWTHPTPRSWQYNNLSPDDSSPIVFMEIADAGEGRVAVRARARKSAFRGALGTGFDPMPLNVWIALGRRFGAGQHGECGESIMVPADCTVDGSRVMCSR